MELLKLTPEELIFRARSYLPMAQKREFVERVAPKCVNLVSLGAAENGEKQNVMLPDMHMENTERKARFLMGALVKLYLKIDFDGAEGDPDLLSWDDYDRFAGNHVINQIERMKSDRDVRDKCFDLLQDYRVLEKMLNTEVYGMLQVQNDPLTRFLAYMQMTTTPENIRKMQEQTEKLQAELQSYAKEREKTHEQG